MGAYLTYCGNVHPAEDLDAWFAVTERHALPIAEARRAQGRPFGLGAWWSAPVAARLAAEPASLEAMAEFLRRHDLSLWTFNVFPYDGFHDDSVKTAVYAPDWACEERLVYTREVAEVGAGLGAGIDGELALSTLPLGYRGPGQEADLRRMARNLARAASAFADIEARTGICPVLALEPEPCCLLERVEATADFLERWLFEPGAWTVPEDVLRRHLGVCIDLCHLFVVGEDPLAAAADLDRRGIRVPKVQVSSCLEVRRPDIALHELLAFDEPRYLHQTFGASGLRALDLPEVRERLGEFRRESRVRTHFHMPLDWDLEGPFGSTRDEVVRCLREWPRTPPLLEVETYTWGVLGGAFHEAPLSDNLLREMGFADISRNDES